MKELSLPHVSHDDAKHFETYKQCPDLLLSQRTIPLTESANLSQCSKPSSAVEAECFSRGLGSSMQLLFDDSLVALPRGSKLAICSLDDDTEDSVETVDVGDHLTSLVKVVGKSCYDDKTDATLLIAGTQTSALVVFSVAKDSKTRIICRATVSIENSSFIFVSSASSIPGGLLILAYRTVKASAGSNSKSHVEVIAIRLRLETGESRPEKSELVKPLCLCVGFQPPLAAHWFGADALVVARSSYTIGSVVDHDHSWMEDGTVITKLRLPGPLVGAHCDSWRLSGGELLAAWTKPEVAGEANIRLAVSTADKTRGAILFDINLPSQANVPQFCNALFLPALGTCAAARQHLHITLVSPNRGFIALIESMGRHAVSIFKNPVDAARAPTAAVDLSTVSGIREAEVLAAVLTDKAVVINLQDCVVICYLNPSAKVPDIPKQLVSSDRMPLGIDPKALLRMLDLHGDD